MATPARVRADIDSASVRSSPRTGAPFSPSGAPLQCICSICTCGLHHCPAPTAPRLPFTGSSTYHADFVAHAVCPVHRHAMVYAPGPHVPFDGATTSGLAFQAPPAAALSAAGRMSARAAPSPRPEDRFFDTESRAAYAAPPPSGPVVHAHAPAGEPRVHVPFDGATTSSLAYQAPSAEALGAAMRSPARAVPSPRPEDRRFDTESRAAFAAPPPSGPVVHAHAPAGEPRVHVPFDATTTAHDDYAAPPVEARCPVLDLPPPPAAEPGTRHQLYDTNAHAWTTQTLQHN